MPALAVPGWWRCRSCRRRAYFPGNPSACQCATCGESLEPILQPERVVSGEAEGEQEGAGG